MAEVNGDHQQNPGNEAGNEANRKINARKSSYWHDVTVDLNYIFSEHWLGLLIGGSAFALILAAIITTVSVGWGAIIGAAILVAIIFGVMIRIAAKRRSPDDNEQILSISTMEMMQARSKIISAIRVASSPMPAHHKNEKMAEELFLRASMTEFQTEMQLGLMLVHFAIENGITEETADFTLLRNKTKEEWLELVREVAQDVFCGSYFGLIAIREGKERAAKLIALINLLVEADAAICPGALAQKHRARNPQNTPLPGDQWPELAWAIARAAIPGEKGVGDTIARLLGRDSPQEPELAGLALPSAESPAPPSNLTKESNIEQSSISDSPASPR